MAAGLD